MPFIPNSIRIAKDFIKEHKLEGCKDAHHVWKTIRAHKLNDDLAREVYRQVGIKIPDSLILR